MVGELLLLLVAKQIIKIALKIITQGEVTAVVCFGIYRKRTI